MKTTELSWEHTIQKAMFISRTFGLNPKKVKFVQSIFGSSNGEYCPTTKSIKITFSESKHDFWCIFFHELSHFIDHKNGVHSEWYNFKHPNNPLELEFYKKMTIEIEKDTDRLASCLMSLYFPEELYRGFYIENPRMIKGLLDSRFEFIEELMYA